MFPSEVRITPILGVAWCDVYFSLCACIHTDREITICARWCSFFPDWPFISKSKYWVLKRAAQGQLKMQLSKPVKQPGVGFETQDANMGQMRQIKLTVIHIHSCFVSIIFQKKNKKSFPMFKTPWFFLNSFLYPNNIPTCFPMSDSAWGDRCEARHPEEREVRLLRDRQTAKPNQRG